MAIVACDRGPDSSQKAKVEALTPASHDQCAGGFERRDGVCKDIDECSFVATPCGTPLATCANKPGGYECSCPKGYAGGGPLGIACSPRLVAALAATCILPESGGVQCWGAENAGVSTDGSPRNASHHLRTIPGTERAVALTIGHNHACILHDDATAKCWGGNKDLQLGRNGGFDLQPGPVPGLHDVIAVQAAGAFACALQRDGVIQCWGANHSLQLGRETSAKTGAPAPVPIPPAVAVAVGVNYACALHRDGTAHCWGDNAWGQLGGATSPTQEDRLPLSVEKLAGAVQLAAGGRASGAVLHDGHAVWWGTNEADNDTSHAVGRSFTTTPARMGAIDRAVAIDGFNDNICVMRQTGEVFCQGTGPLGDGRSLDSAVPVQVQSPERALALAVSSSQKCFLAATGAVICWGANSKKLHGDVTQDWIVTPRAVPGVDVFVGVRP